MKVFPFFFSVVIVPEAAILVVVQWYIVGRKMFTLERDSAAIYEIFAGWFNFNEPSVELWFLNGRFYVFIIYFNEPSGQKLFFDGWSV